MKRKGAIILAAAFTLLAAAGCGGQSNQGDNSPEPPAESPTAAYEKLPELRLSTFNAVDDKPCKVKMRAPYTDTYTFNFSDKCISLVELFDEKGNAILPAQTEPFDLELNEGQLVYAQFTPVNDLIKINIAPTENKNPLPFEVGEAPDADAFEIFSDNPAVDPLQAAELYYKKRENTLYVYCNAPEELMQKPEVINHCITRQDVSNQHVYFTMEQQSEGLLKNGYKRVYYGYRVRNTGTEDMYITVKNIGYQLGGDGCYLGEQEWTHFYNTRFALPDLESLTEEQMKSYKAWFGFSGKYMLSSFQPTTYRVPAGEYMYVLGGTSEDAFGNYNVAGTANRATSGSVQNGAVLFDVIGQAEGAYYVYDDYNSVLPGMPGGDDHLGITDAKVYGVVHTGEDVGFVVDNQATWTFNDATPAQRLPVTFINSYKEDVAATGTPGAAIESTDHVQNRTDWVTHINVQTHPEEAVGTDMTSFHTKDPDGNDITVGCWWYDTRGRLANIGNWMKDYQDVYTFVNQGDEARTIKIKINATGGVAGMIRNMDGTIVEDTAKFYMAYGGSAYGDAFDLGFKYEVEIPAHTVVQFVMEYNLMANSYGYLKHYVELV